MPGSRSPEVLDTEHELEVLVERFEQAWQEGIPVIADFMPRVPSKKRLAGDPARRELLHELVKIDLEHRWRGPEQQSAGPLPGRPRLENYVAHLAELGSLQQLPVELIGEEYRVRERWGDKPGHAEYFRRFAGREADLRWMLARVDAELATEFARKEILPGPSKPLPSPGRECFRCPHCRHPIELGNGPRLSALACPQCGAAFSIDNSSAPPSEPLRPPMSRLGRYELGGLLGKGAFGTVWLARDTKLDREVALKLPRGGRFLSAEEEERFLREARFAAHLRHPGIVGVHDVGREGDTLYIVSDLIRGMSLAERLRQVRFSFSDAAALLAEVADALDYAHRQGVVHRDVKPSNILLEQENALSFDASCLTPRSVNETYHPRITDFGLALRDAGEVTMTLDGQVLGTPAYMSPEQIRDPHALDGRSDVYSLGVMLYEFLTGGVPFRGVARMLLLQVVADEPRPPRLLNDAIPRDLETICLKCLQKEPRRRYPTAAALAADLRRWQAGEPILARPVGRTERLLRWLRNNPGLTLAGVVASVALVTLTGAPAAVAVVGLAIGSLGFALSKAKSAVELAHSIEILKQEQKRTASGLEFAIQHYQQARLEKDRAVAAEALARRRSGPMSELARAFLRDFPERILDPAGERSVPSFVVAAVLAYLDALAQQPGNEASTLRDLAIAYAKMGDVQAHLAQGNRAAALPSFRKSLAIFARLASAHPDNIQAQRDLAEVNGKC